MNTAQTLIAALLLAASAQGQQVHIGVLSLFHPRELEISAPQGAALLLLAGQKSLVIERSSGASSAQIRISSGEIGIIAGTQRLRGATVLVTSRDLRTADFQLAIPGKISRHYRGSLEIRIDSGALSAVVTMDLETAVASVVGSESTADTPLEALKAQAVATRSYFVASRGRHHGFNFCDTTHCQFLRAPPAPGSAAAQATEATRGLVLAFQSQPVAGMYTRSCSGSTHSPAEVGLPPSPYPYYSVECKYCRERPHRWQRRLSPADAEQLRKSNEGSRLNLNRRLGWNTVPSNDFTMKREGDVVVLRGAGMGHGIGLCQAGANAMANSGADFREILAHYYPNSNLLSQH
jgi:stage II sporulation protein D